MKEKTQINIKDGTIQICSFAFKGCDYLTEILIPDSVTSIGDEAFRSCSLLKKVTMPNSVSTVGKGVFYGCKSLKSVILSKNITTLSSFMDKRPLSMGEMLYGGDGVYFGGFFENCYSLSTITIPNSITNVECDAFSCCSSLKEIICLCKIPPKLFGHYYPYEGYVKNIFISQDCILKIPKGTKQAYMDAWGVEEQDVEEFELTSGDCGENVSYELKDNGALIITGNGTIADNAFENDNRIKKVIIEEGGTFIGANSFKDCKRLRFIEIASSVEEIGDWAFAGCENMISIIVKSDLPPIVGGNVFEGLENSVEIVVPASTIRYYKAAKGWNKFTNYVAIDLC